MSGPTPQSTRLLVKLRPTADLGLAATSPRLRPLFEDGDGGVLRIAGDARRRWFVADLEEGAPTPWDLAHGRVAEGPGLQGLGLHRSDVEYVEPDLIHDIYPDPQGATPDGPFALVQDCRPGVQSDDGGQAPGPHDRGWHLDDGFSQLGEAREAVRFDAPRTRIAQLDTGYSRRHAVRPTRILEHLERSFVDGDAAPSTAEDPDRDVWPIDNSGHGTGTLSILAGAAVPAWNGKQLGGVLGAEILPLRIADSVVLLKTSAFARALQYALDHGCDVLTMSMGGLPSRLWRETVDRAYRAGMCMVAAAGNNFNGAPTRKIVYPARYDRVLAVCGAMADGKAYAELDGLKTMEGNYGPKSRMEAAMAAYTPNIPWAVFGCDDAVRLSGGGTSSATPQVAAAAALWFEKYKHELPRDWRRVEAVRHALFEAAEEGDRKRLGRGVLKAADALEVPPVLNLPRTSSDSDSFAFFRLMTGLGIAEPSPREEMFNLELQQRWLVNPELDSLLPDPRAVGPDGPDPDRLEKVMEAVIEDEGASDALRRHMVERYTVITGRTPKRTRQNGRVVPEALGACEMSPALEDPPYRRLRVYSGDPSLSAKLDTADSNEITLEVRWEELKPGPEGEYLKVEADDASGRTYEPLDLNDPRLLARDGWAPSAGNAQFHQQMVYAVCMKTIDHFERALGRPMLWRPEARPGDPTGEETFVQHLRVRPHALQQANAFYSPEEVALKFGYFDASPEDSHGVVPGSRVYTCLSHDIVAHETAHALLDGMNRRFEEPTNPDVLAFHEAFADVVALMQDFTMRDVLVREISATRGDLEAESRLGSLAIEFGRSLGRRNALRDAIGRVEDGVWKRNRADPARLERSLAPHSRGAVLVAAVFDAFIAIYNKRTEDLLRIYTGGTGVLAPGEIHPDLVSRLASEAATSAEHVLRMCIRAIDYLPPVDVTFFEFLRALITADHDLVRDDRLDYRVAFVESFRRHGIVPADLSSPSPDTPRTMSVETLRWQGTDQSEASRELWAELATRYPEILDGLETYANACTYFSTRRELFEETCRQKKDLQMQLTAAVEGLPGFARELGVDATSKGFRVHELRRAMRTAPDGRVKPQVILSLTESKQVAKTETTPAFVFHGGSTLVVDLSVPEVEYRIVKNLASGDRQRRTADFYRSVGADPLMRRLCGLDGGEPFAALHALTEQ